MIKLALTSILSCLATFVAVLLIFMTSDSVSVGEQIVFRSEDGQFEYTAVPSKGRGHEAMEQAFTAYKQEAGISADMKLYRATRKNYLKISKWCAYKHLPEWQYALKK